jgi:tetratricopeptide (TPR) repeat protein
MGQLAAIHLELGQLDQALALGEETLQRMKGSAHEHPMMTFVMENLADTYRYSGKNRQAVELGQEAVKRTEAKNGKDHPETLAALCKLIEFLAVTKNYTDAESSSRILLERVKQRTEALPETCVEALGSAGRILVSRKQWASAEPILRECLAIREKTQSNGWDTFNSRSMLGGALLGQGKVTEAQALVVGAYEQMEKMQETIAGANDKRDDWLDAMDRFETLYESCGDKPEAARWRTEIERVRRITDPGAVRRWLILTPIALARGQSSLTGMESEQIDHEADLRPLSGNKMSVNGRDLVWTEHALRDYTINFNELLGDETPWSVAYAVCYVKMAAPRKDLVLKVGSDDQARVYINGKKVYENRTNRGMILDEDTIDNVELRAGLDVVVFKVVNGRYGWRGALRFAEKDGQAVAGLNVTLEPD